MSNYFSFPSVLLLFCRVLFLLFLMDIMHSAIPSLLSFSLSFALLPCFLYFFSVMVVLGLKYSPRSIATELGVALLLRGEGVAIGDGSSPVKSCLVTSPFGDGYGDRDGDRGFGDTFLLLVSLPMLGMVCYFSLAAGLFNLSWKSSFSPGRSWYFSRINPLVDFFLFTSAGPDAALWVAEYY